MHIALQPLHYNNYTKNCTATVALKKIMHKLHGNTYTSQCTALEVALHMCITHCVIQTHKQIYATTPVKSFFMLFNFLGF